MKDFIFSFSQQEHCLPGHYQEVLEAVDKELSKAGITLHMTTLERITDAVFGYIKENSATE